MLNLHGSEYIIDHCIEEYIQKVERSTFRIYVGDMLKAIAESWGATVNHRYYDLIHRPKKETRTGDEIALEVIKRAGLKVKQNDTNGISGEDFA